MSPENMYNLEEAYSKEFFKSNYEDTWPMANYLAPLLKNYFKLKNVLDLGCASGHYIKAFRDCGVTAWGFEGSDNVKGNEVCPPHCIKLWDLRKKMPAALLRITMVMSVEVAEHIEEEFVDNYIHNIIMHNPKYIYITASPPGQDGHYHVNCQPQEYWIEKFNKHGYVNNIKHKNHINGWLRERCDCYFINEHNETNCQGLFIPNWFPKNLMVFEK